MLSSEKHRPGGPHCCCLSILPFVEESQLLDLTCHLSIWREGQEFDVWLELNGIISMSKTTPDHNLQTLNTC